MRLVVPLPAPSENTLWRGKRFPTMEYKKWTSDFLWLVKRAELVPSKSLKVVLTFYWRNANLRDVSNGDKAVLDALTKAKIIPDDRYIQELTLRKFKSQQERIEIEISEYGTTS